MAIYEYIVAFTAILLGLATAKILHALPYVFSKNQRDWTHSFLFVNVMVNQPLTWWATWAYAKVETWTFFTFMLVILMFAFKYLLADQIASTNPEKSSHGRNIISK